MIKYEILMPMAGLGQRFKEKGFNTPKPLIDFKGKPLFLQSILSLQPILKQSRVSFIVNKEDQISDLVKMNLTSTDLNFQIIELESRTRGAAETVLKARDFIDESLPLLSIDCDLIFSSNKYFLLINEHKDKLASGVLCYFKSENPRFSFIKSDDNDNVTQIAEKKVISDKALIGSYFFSKGSLAFDTIHSLVNSTEEIYLSHIIADMIKNDHIFTCCISDSYKSLGTPEELTESLK